MGGKVVVSAVSIILVVGVIVGVVAVVHYSRNNNEFETLSTSKKMVDSLCTAATYKDTCTNKLDSLPPDEKSTKQGDHEVIRGGLKMAMDEVGKGDEVADSLMSKAKEGKNATQIERVLKQCKHWYDLGKTRLNGTYSAFSNSNADIFKDDKLIWEIRLMLTDVLTFADTCADELEQADAVDLANSMRDGVKTGRELTASMLDIITVFKDALAQSGGSTSDPAKLEEAAVKAAAKAGIGGDDGHRRLFTIPVDEEGVPHWFSSRMTKEGDLINWDKANVPVPPRVPAGAKPPPNVVVALDGSGQFKSIMEALKTHPGNTLVGPFIIYVKAGTYNEEVLVSQFQPNVFMYGDGPDKTIITGSKNFGIMKIGTAETAPFNVEGHNFFCKDMGFQNTAGPEGHQAVALRVNCFHAVFVNCKFDAFQDTLYTQGGAHYFRDCEILGTVDFIFGNGATLIQNSKIIARKPGAGQSINVVTAQGRGEKSENSGIVLQGCTITAEPALEAVKKDTQNYLGRPWKQFANTIFMECEIGDFILPVGYELWQGKTFHETCFYGEYNNRGPGANTASRAKWNGVKVLTKPEAEKYSATPFLKGAEWVTNTGAPINMGLTS